MKRILSLTLAILMLAMSSLMIVSCNKEETEASTSTTLTFKFEVVHLDGTTKSFDITTTETLVGKALVAQGLISGDDDQYGLYVKTVDGETLDYDTQKAYWAFYEGDVYASKGVDQTEIQNGATYKFKAGNA